MAIRLLLAIGIVLSSLNATSDYVKQIKVWDACTYAMETIRIDLVQLQNRPFEEIDPDTAIDYCTNSLRTYPNDPHVKFLLARAYTKAKEYKKGYRLASEACLAGDVGGCTLVGGYLSHYLIRRQDAERKSVLLWLWSCSHGDAQACTNLYIKSPGPFIPKAIEQTRERLLDFCTEGIYPLACNTYAKECFQTKDNSKICQKAAQHSCISGNEEGCLFYRELQQKEQSISPKSIRNTYQHSCNNGNYKACLSIAHYYSSQPHTKINNVLALALYEDTCNKGHDATACRYAGHYYLGNFEGIDTNIPKGLHYLKLSCTPFTIHKETPGHSSTQTIYDIEGCYDLATYYLYTPHPQYRSKTKAKKTLEDACQLIQYYKTDQLGCQLHIKSCCEHLPSR